MKKYLTLALLLSLVAVAAPALAGPMIVAVPAANDPNDPQGFGPTTIPGGIAYDVYFEDTTPVAVGITSITFSGSISQEQGKPTKNSALVNIDNDSNAASADGRSGTTYVAANDSFFFNSAGEAFSSQFGTISQTATTYTNGGIGTTPGTLFTSALLARIVSTGGPITFTTTGGTSIGGSQSTPFSLSGTLSVPEPATWALLGLGVVGFLPFLRKRSRKAG